MGVGMAPMRVHFYTEQRVLAPDPLRKASGTMREQWEFGIRLDGLALVI
jgi:hypothetical protein